MISQEAERVLTHQNDEGKEIMPSSPQSMWEEYMKGRSPDLRRKIAQQYLNLVNYVAGKCCAPPGSSSRALEKGDLVQVGVIGLLDAIDRFDPMRGVKFETYAVIRIRGAIQDELRKLDWVPRSVRKKAKEAQDAAGPDSMSSWLGNTYPQGLLRLDEAEGKTVNSVPGEHYSIENASTEGSPDLAETVGADQLKDMLVRLLEKLPDDERLILTLYYYEDLTFKEIGHVLQLSESRVFQKHAATVKRLRAQLGDSQ